jgi:cytochrome c-type biogenesis protein CcmH/NrfG
VLVLSESRAAWLALAAGAVAIAAFRTSRLGLGLAVAVGGGIAASFVAGIVASDERRAYWAAALGEWADHPLAGSGAGTWGRIWLERRDELLTAVDAHSLYLEALAELGPVALVLLVLLLFSPLVAASRAGASPAVPAAAAALVALTVHLAADWDWELPAVTAAGLLCAAALLLSARSTVVRVPRAAAVVAGIAAFAAILPLLAGNVLHSRAVEALREGDPAAARRDARRAARLQPWAAAPWRVLAEAELQQGDRDAARQGIERAADRDPTDVEVWRTAARVLRGSARLEAEAKVRELDPLATEAPSR